jgi:hypothetical protein
MIQGLTRLERLDFLATAVSNAGVIDLMGLSNLRSLNVRGARVDDFGAKDVRRALGNVKIEFRRFIVK